MEYFVSLPHPRALELVPSIDKMVNKSIVSEKFITISLFSIYEKKIDNAIVDNI